MVSPDDIVEIVLEHLQNPGPLGAGSKDFRKALEQPAARKGRWGFHLKEPFTKPYTSLPAKKIFLSEYDIKRLLAGGKKDLRIPAGAIVSPLAQDWLDLKGIKIVRE